MELLFVSYHQNGKDPSLLYIIYIYHPRADGAKRRARVLIPPRLFTPGETKALAESKVHQLSRAWVTNGVGWVVILTDLKNIADCHEKRTLIGPI
jgi:hypothetical protein